MRFVVLTYDDNGNLVSDGDMDFAYDVFNRLVKVTKSADGSTIAEYAYDGVSRRVQKTVGADETRYVYDGSDVICEYNANDALVCRYILGRSIDEPMRMERLIEGEWRKFYYQTNSLGSIVALTEWDSGDETERAVERYTYDAYGGVSVWAAGPDGIFGTSDDDYSATSSVGNPYGFTARRLDTETGLMYYRARYYSPAQGRFVNRDPVGYVDGMNLYSAYFVPSSVDPFGKRYVKATAHKTTAAELFGKTVCKLCPGRKVKKSKAQSCGYDVKRCQGLAERIFNLTGRLNGIKQQIIQTANTQNEMWNEFIPKFQRYFLESAAGEAAGLAMGSWTGKMDAVGSEVANTVSDVNSIKGGADWQRSLEAFTRRIHELTDKLTNLRAKEARLEAKMNSVAASLGKVQKKITGDECCCPAE